MSLDDRVNILLVDDQPAKLLTYEVILRDLGENLIKASSAREGLECLLKTDVAVILVDVSMPELDGFQFAAMVRDHPRFEKTPIIFISAIHVSEPDRIRGYEKGAVDYVPVPVVPEILRAKVRVFVELHRKTRQLEQFNRELEERVASRTEELQSSLTQLSESEERLRLASEAAGFGTYDFNAATQRIHCSPSLLHLLGIEAEGELSLEEFLQPIHPEEREAMRRIMLSAREAGTDRHEMEFRAVRPDGTTRWLLDRGRLLQRHGEDADQHGRVMGTILDITTRKLGEDRQKLLMAELDHRVKNVLANVSAISRLSSARAASVKEFVGALDGRIQAMAQAHSMLRHGNWDGADLTDLIKALLSPFRAVGSGNIEIRGGPIQLGTKAAQSLALVVHELATNAVKYGALSAPNGKIDVSWVREPNGHGGPLKLRWEETGGPAVVKPQSTGFGFTALHAAAAEFGAELVYEFRPEGLICSLEGQFERPNAGAHREVAAVLGEARIVLNAVEHPAQHCRILVIEDEPLVALQLQADLEGDGHEVLGPAGDLTQGLALAKGDMDIALLDISLGQDVSTPIADHLLSRHIPFAFATGYADDTLLPPHLRGVPRLSKPYVFDDVRRLVGQLASASAAKNGG